MKPDGDDFANTKDAQHNLGVPGRVEPSFARARRLFLHVGLGDGVIAGHPSNAVALGALLGAATRGAGRKSIT